MKNRILLENYYLPGQLEHSIGEFVEFPIFKLIQRPEDD